MPVLRGLVFVCVLALALVPKGVRADALPMGGENDLVQQVPGLLFNVNFKTYSGYLYGNDDKSWKMHYMLTESRNDPANAPLLVWFNGGPGCSSFSGAFEELGPFYINSDGNTLFENVYSWNQHANVLYIESPVGTGFSYDTTNPKFYYANDTQTLGQNVHAIKDFFTRAQTKYQNKDFYMSGESYAGIYLPMLGAAISQDKTFPANLKGIAIGNGFMNVKMLTNSLVLWSNYHGRVSLDDWKVLKDSCCTSMDKDDCDWTQYLTTTNNIDYVGDTSACGKILNNVINATGLFNIDPYNYYEDCYNGAQITYKSQFGRLNRIEYQRRRASVDAGVYNPNSGVNTANQINRDSTDFLNGYPCFQETYVGKYFNQDAVQKAYNIDPVWKQSGLVFSDCNADTYNHYVLTEPDMTKYFNTMIENFKDFHILVYNGDVDTVCNFLGDAKFINQVAGGKQFTHNARQRWFFRDQLAGFYQTYTGGNNFKIDVLTVKGAGHMVPMDRPGPSLQMITNFIKNIDYNTTTAIDPTAVPNPLLTNALPSASTGASASSAVPNSFSTPAPGSAPSVFCVHTVLLVLVAYFLTQ